MKEFKSSAGANIVINEAPFEDAMLLKNSVTREMGDAKFNLSMLDSSPTVYNALWPCLIRCTYDGEKITKKLFDDPAKPAAREDYYEIINACVEVNLRPFIKGLGLAFNLFENQSNTNTPATK